MMERVGYSFRYVSPFIALYLFMNQALIHPSINLLPFHSRNDEWIEAINQWNECLEWNCLMRKGMIHAVNENGL